MASYQRSAILRQTIRMLESQSRKYDGLAKRAEREAIASLRKNQRGEAPRALVHANTAIRCKKESIEFTRWAEITREIKARYEFVCSAATVSKRMAEISASIDRLDEVMSASQQMDIIMELKTKLEDREVSAEAVAEVTEDEVAIVAPLSEAQLLLERLAAENNIAIHDEIPPVPRSLPQAPPQLIDAEDAEPEGEAEAEAEDPILLRMRRLGH